MSSIKVAIIGFGMSGACFHAPILRDMQDYEIVAIVSSRIDEVHGYLPDAQVFADTNSMLGESDAELCIIATTNEMHVPLARACLEAGRHVVVEKPFVLDPLEGLALDTLARQKGLSLTVYQNRRWDGDFLTLCALIAQGKIGKPHTLESHYDRWRPNIQDRWRERPGPGAGILWDLGPHLIDQALVLLGPARTVTARLANSRAGASVTDHFHILIEHDDAVSILHADSQTCAPGPRFMLHGDRGSFVKYGMDNQENCLREKQGPNCPDWGKDPQDHWGLLTQADEAQTQIVSHIETEAGCYEQFYQLLARSIRDKAPQMVPVTASSAIDVIALILAAQKSANEGQTISL
ncbi:Gfo/Idh/MocA family oxidoreductase [uncultured Cohaesibacter sp.]|uniref:Gfo/Idh/MocA family oxidoreductase n=1 Tax=uncultured Cohaesibacter sp. TaxID=1002546 RepID=UPI00292D9D7A|nr:Gfo/Idh/MocA family oxidoreductase [uncultured Cohaesibacter sp.]